MEDLISVVIPVYNEGKSIYKNVCAISNILKDNYLGHEFILIDDGSKDNSWEEMVRLQDVIGKIQLIKLSRNFGKENALCAGLDAVTGNCCVVLDSDLQHPPELIPDMYKLWKQDGYEVIEGVKSSRGKESLKQKLTAKLFYKSLKSFSGIDLDNASDFRFMDVAVINAWRQLPERQTFFRGMSTWVGFTRTQIHFEVKPRLDGETGWSTKALIKLAINAITSYSALPLQITTFMGFLFFLFFIFMICQTLYMKIFGHAVEGFTTTIILLLMIGSILMVSNGILGLYLSKIYEEVKNRPRYIVQRVIKKDNNNKE